MTTDQSARERAQDAAGTAAEEGRHVAGTAKDEAQRVASEAASQARSVVGDALGQVSEQSAAQKDRLASTLRTLGEDLDSMAGRGTPGLAADLARQASEQARSLGTHLEGREPSELLDDVRRFARQRPGTFLLGALAAGVVVGRLVRGTADGIQAAEAAGGRVTPSPSPTPATPPTTPPVSPVPPTSQTTPAFTTGAGAETPVPPAPPVPPVGGSGTLPDEPPMSAPHAGYGERGVTGSDGDPGLGEDLR